MLSNVEIVVQEEDVNFFAALKNPEAITPLLLVAMEKVMQVYQEAASVYAPESEANHPGRFSLVTHKPMGFYERGRGWWYPLVRQRVKSKRNIRPSLKAPRLKGIRLGITALSAQSIQGVTGYKLIQNSEQMDTKWQKNVYEDQGIVTGALTNGASYFPYVQGLEQSKLHLSRGWDNVTVSWNKDAVQEAVNVETSRALDTFYNL